MKKKLIIIISIIIVLLGIGLLCYFNENIRFKISYEYLNIVEDSNGKTVKVNIPFKNNIKYIKGKEVGKTFKNKTGIVYLGYNTCPWCRSIIETLIDVAKDNNKTIYYVDLHNINKETKKELKDYLSDYLEERDGVKGFSSPDVYFIKNGKIETHVVGSGDAYDYPYKKLSKKEKNNLRKVYMDGIELIK